MATTTVRPVSDGAINNWSLVEGYSSKVGDQSDSTYIQSGSGADNVGVSCVCDTFNETNVTINSVKVRFKAKSSSTGTPGVKATIVIGGTEYAGSTTHTIPASSGAWTWFEETWNANPAGGSWQLSDVSGGIDVGVYIETGVAINRVRVSEIEAEIDYTASGGPVTVTPSANSAKSAVAIGSIVLASITLSALTAASSKCATQSGTIVFTSTTATPSAVESVTSTNRGSVLPQTGSNTEYKYSASDGANQWAASAGSRYACVDDANPGNSTSAPNTGSIDDDSTYVWCEPTSTKLVTFGCTSDGISSTDQILSVRIKYRAKKTGGTGTWTLRPMARIAEGTWQNSYGTTVTLTTAYQDFESELTRPNGGNWTSSDFSSLEFGFENVYTTGTTNYQMRVTSAYLEVAYNKIVVVSNPVASAKAAKVDPTCLVQIIPSHSPASAKTDTYVSGTPIGYELAPSDLECERQSEPTNVSERPIFTALFNSETTPTFVKVWIQVATDSSFANTIWNSYWVDITEKQAFDRSPAVQYSGPNLSSSPPNGWYYWRIKAETSTGRETEWSSYARFKGINRDWWDPNYIYRRKLLLNDSHSLIPSGSTLDCNLQTGYVRKVATNAVFQTPARMVQYGNRTHIAYLGKNAATGMYSIYVVSYDALTDQWGTPYEVDDAKTSFDTHHFPEIYADRDGYLYLFYGCHGSPMYWAISQYSNQSGSLSGDGGWTLKGTIGTELTYPFAFSSSNGWVYVVAREGTPTNLGRKIKLYVLKSRTGNWIGATIIEDDVNPGDAVYCYGVLIDSKDRLHLSFTFLKTLNTHYVYSDLETDTTLGYDKYRTADGTVVGTISGGGVKRSANPEIVHAGFNQGMGLTTDNRGFPIWTYGPSSSVAGGDGDGGIGVSLYDGNQWVHSDITAKTGIYIKGGINGFVGEADPDGAMHVYTIADSLKNQRIIATSDVSQSNASKYPTDAPSFYSCVDDGALACDDDATYITGTGSWSAIFGHSDTFADTDKIAAVGIWAMMIPIEDNGSYKLVLKINGTEYESPAIPNASPYVYTYIAYMWDENPATGLPWTASDVNNIEFGFKGVTTGVTARLSNIHLKVHVVDATSIHNYNAEPVQFTSIDGGETWSSKFLTGNTSVGSKSLYSKRNRGNKAIELNWCAGNDLFYWSNVKRLGKIRNDARDLRLVYAKTNDVVEVDRILDHANVTSSCVTFVTPGSIAANMTAADGDLYLYYGYIDADNDALSDPYNVYPVSFENFERDASYTSYPYYGSLALSGVGNWDIVAGSGTLWVNPPGHQNKIADGSRSLDVIAIGSGYEHPFQMEHALPSSYNYLSMRGYVFTAKNTYVGIAVSGSSNQFQLKLNQTTTDDLYCAQYSISGQWHNSDVVVSGGQMYRMRIDVTPSGAYAWMDDQVVASGVLFDGGVNRLKAFADFTTNFFDRLYAYELFQDQPAVTVGDEEVRGIAVGASILGVGQKRISVGATIEGYQHNDGSIAKLKTDSRLSNVILGSISLAPVAVAAVATTNIGDVILGSISFSVDTASAATSVAGPDVFMSSTTSVPDYVGVVAVSAIGDVILGSVNVSCDPASAATSSVISDVILGNTTATPVSSDVSTGVSVGDVILGSIALDPESASSKTETSLGSVVQGSIAVSANVSAVAETIAPTVILGSITFAPSSSSAVAVSSIGDVVLGSMTVISDSVSVKTQTNIGDTVQGSIAISANVYAVAVTVDPGVVLGSVSVVPDVASAATSIGEFTWIMSSMDVSTTVVTARALAVDPIVWAGPIVLTPLPATCIADTTIGSIVQSSLSLTPGDVSAVTGVSSGDVIYGSILLTVDPASVVASVFGPAVVLGSTSVSEAVASAATSVGDPAIIYGSINIPTSAAVSVCSVSGPAIELSSTTATPDSASCVASVVNPHVIEGDTILLPGSVSCKAVAIIGGIVQTSITTSAPYASARTGRLIGEVVQSSLVLTGSASASTSSTLGDTVLGSVSLSGNVVAVADTGIADVVLGSVTVAGSSALAVTDVSISEIYMGSMDVFANIPSAVCSVSGPFVAESLILSPVTVVCHVYGPTIIFGSTSASGTASAVADTLDPIVLIDSSLARPYPVTAVCVSTIGSIRMIGEPIKLDGFTLRSPRLEVIMDAPSISMALDRPDASGITEVPAITVAVELSGSELTKIAP